MKNCRQIILWGIFFLLLSVGWSQCDEECLDIKYDTEISILDILYIVNIIFEYCLMIVLGNSSPNNKIIYILFGILALLTMLHSAMRIAMPCFAYAVQFINFRDEV
mgnify:CR=1 FL=1